MALPVRGFEATSELSLEVALTRELQPSRGLIGNSNGDYYNDVNFGDDSGR